MLPRMAQALRNENGDLVRQNPKYVVQMTSGSEGVKRAGKLYDCR